MRLTGRLSTARPRVARTAGGAVASQPDLDYVSTTLVRTLPRGFDAELVRVPVLVEQGRIPVGPHREHVTYGVKNSPDVHRCSGHRGATPRRRPTRHTGHRGRLGVVGGVGAGAVDPPRRRSVRVARRGGGVGLFSQTWWHSTRTSSRRRSRDDTVATAGGRLTDHRRRARGEDGGVRRTGPGARVVRRVAPAR